MTVSDFTIDPAEMARLSQEAYQPNPDFAIDGVEFLVREIGQSTFAVAFRGTTFNGKDIIRDFRIMPTWNQKLGIVHRGFLKGAQAAFPYVHGELIKRHALNVVCTGHSLGAAYATLTACWLTWDYIPSQIQLCTFGSPRVGRSLERHLKRVQIRRYIYGGDIVTTVPWPIVYRHAGKPLHIGPGNSENRDGFLDHRIRRYVETLA